MLSAESNTKTLFLAIPRPLPWDNALFSEVDFVMAEIRRFYEELNIFWEEETRHVAEALKKGRPDPTDFERWSNSHSSLRRTIEDWKVFPLYTAFPKPNQTRFQNQAPSGESTGEVQTQRSNNTSLSTVCPSLFYFSAF